MTKAELIAALANVPDDAIVLVENEEELRYYDMHVRFVLEPVLDHGWAVLFEPGQCWNLDYDLDARIDAKIGYQG